MGPALLIAALLAMLGGAVYIAFTGSNLHGDFEMSAHGYIAMTLGIVFSMIVGVGLMALVFISSRRGYDEIGGRETEKSDEAN
jgi:hypothetical protein